MSTKQTWGRHDTLQPLGDGVIQITVLRNRTHRCDDTGLLTVRCKDQDLTADQFDALAEACAKAARRLRGRLPTPTTRPAAEE